MDIKKKMQKEATKRLKILEKQGLYDEVIEQWGYGRACFAKAVDVFGIITGVNFTFEEMPELNSLKEAFEKECNCIVFYGVYFERFNSRFISLLFVSDEEYRWKQEHIDLKKGFHMAYTIDINNNMVEVGDIWFEMAQGGLILMS